MIVAGGGWLTRLQILAIERSQLGHSNCFKDDRVQHGADLFAVSALALYNVFFVLPLVLILPAAGMQEFGIVDVLMVTDASVSDQYGVLRWAVATGEPGHTFVLVHRTGEVAWIRDYGAPENGGVMHVPQSKK